VPKSDEFSLFSSDTRNSPDAVRQFNANAPVQLLQIILLRIVDSGAGRWGFTQPSTSSSACFAGPFACLQAASIPVKPRRDPTLVVYRSALPQVLSGQNLDRRQAIATALQHQIQTYQSQVLATTEFWDKDLVCGFTVSVTVQGELEFVLQDHAIAAWLNRLLHPNFTLEAIGTPVLPDMSRRVFVIQHAHARCCSLLKQMQELGLAPIDPLTDIGIKDECADLLAWSVSALLLRELLASERYLVQQLLQTIDLFASLPQNAAKRLFLLTEQIASGFDQVHRDCQLFAPSLLNSSDRLKAHLAVLAATRNILCQSLKGLNLTAPSEL